MRELQKWEAFKKLYVCVKHLFGAFFSIGFHVNVDFANVQLRLELSVMQLTQLRKLRQLPNQCFTAMGAATTDCCWLWL